MNTPKPLFHYTCAHARADIGTHGIIRPSRDTLRAKGQPVPAEMPMITARGFVDVAAMLAISWFTDLDVPDIDGLGLTSRYLINCDRTEFRYELHPDAFRDVEPWLGSTFRTNHWDIACGLEQPGTLPVHWWIAHGPVAAFLTNGGEV